MLARALDNARSARDRIAAVVGERAELTRLLNLPPHDVDDVPGALSILAEDECLRLLATRTVGRLAYVARAGVPDIVPVNYGLDEGDILIRAGAGPKLQAAERRDLVAFEVDELDDSEHSGWSVVVHGRAERTTDASWSSQSGLPQPWAAGPRVHTIRITPRRVTGRRITGASVATS